MLEGDKKMKGNDIGVSPGYQHEFVLYLQAGEFTRPLLCSYHADSVWPSSGGKACHTILYTRPYLISNDHNTAGGLGFPEQIYSTRYGTPVINGTSTLKLHKSKK